MIRNKMKHKVLRVLLDFDYKEWDKNSISFGSPTFSTINEKLKYSGEKIYAACVVLIENGDITQSEEGFTMYYEITNKGRYSYYEKVYLNKIWYRSQKFWSYLVPIFISLGALTVSIVSLYN